MFVARLWLLFFAAGLVFGASPKLERDSPVNLNRKSPTPVKRDGGGSSNFVTSQGGKFFVNGKPFRFVGTNAYWLPTLHTDDDIDRTLGSMASAGIKVVRVWAFNDVEVIPNNGTWFQLIKSDGTTQLNTGPDGLQKLDTILRLAKKHGLYILLTLTNNWNPQSSGTPSTARNTLSNDYGGMDFYVRRFGSKFHDQFYTNDKILSIFSDYVREIVKRYADVPELLAWELANDARCYSSLSSSSSCQPQTITTWHSEIAQVVKSVDPNHLVASGSEGFICDGCPKLFVAPPVAAPLPSGVSGRRRRTVKEILLGRKAIQGRTPGDGLKRAIQIRGRWSSPESRQNDGSSMSSFDGFHGVDSEDILAIPQIGFSTFQLFPDQNVYATIDPNLSPFDRTIQAGIEWIKRQAAIGQTSGKPVLLDAFGLVTQNNLNFFVPFNSSSVSPGSGTNGHSRRQADSSGVTDDQRNNAYSQWFAAALSSGVQGMMQYQWSQGGLTGVLGTDISPSTGGTTTSPDVTGTGLSPNDGYSINGVGQASAIDTIQVASAQFASD